MVEESFDLVRSDLKIKETNLTINQSPYTVLSADDNKPQFFLNAMLTITC